MDREANMHKRGSFWKIYTFIFIDLVYIMSSHIIYLTFQTDVCSILQLSELKKQTKSIKTTASDILSYLEKKESGTHIRVCLDVLNLKTLRFMIQLLLISLSLSELELSKIQCAVIVTVKSINLFIFSECSYSNLSNHDIFGEIVTSRVFILFIHLYLSVMVV